MIGIYKITNKVNGKVYIGQSIHIEKRWRQHCKTKDDFSIHRAIQKYGPENFNFEVLLECPAEMLNNWERDMIALYDCISPKGYNLTEGGEGYKCSEETRLKMSKASKNRDYYWMRNRYVSAETRQKISNNNCNKDPEVRRRKAMAMRSKYTKILQYDLNDNLIREWELISDISKSLNIKSGNIYNVLSGRQKTTGGYKWKFI